MNERLNHNLDADVMLNFSKLQLDIGDGIYPANENDEIELPNDFYCDTDLIEEIYGYALRTNNYNLMDNSNILSPFNQDTIEIGDKVNNLLPDNITTYYSMDSVIEGSNHDNIPVNIEFLNEQILNELPLHELKVKKNTIVILMRNLHTNEGLCNGTRIKITELYPHVLKGKILTGERSRIGQEVFIPRITLHSSDDFKLPFKFARHQFPVRNAFSLTINKSQGQSFDKVGLFLHNDVFSHGQLYVDVFFCA